MTNPLARFVKESDGEGNLLCGALWFWCPGCENLHRVRVAIEGAQNAGVIWQWDGKLDPPTVSPSILTWSTKNDACHSFLKNGIWQFLSDSTHKYSGQNIPMEPLPDWFCDRDDDET